MAPLLDKICPVCGVRYGLDETYYNYRKSGAAAADKRSWYCPNGCSLSVTTTDAAKLRQERDLLKQQLAQKDDEIKWQRESAQRARDDAEHQRHRANGYKGHATRITKRAKAGVCPCCNRTFKQLAEHMARRHPTFTPECPEPPRLSVVGG
jgi:hypothetical protein